jgi:hypothetical protein
MDAGLTSHCALPGRPGCFSLEPERRPTLIKRQISALVEFSSKAVCWAVSQRLWFEGMEYSSARRGFICAVFTIQVFILYGNIDKKRMWFCRTISLRQCSDHLDSE